MNDFQTSGNRATDEEIMRLRAENERFREYQKAIREITWRDWE